MNQGAVQITEDFDTEKKRLEIKKLQTDIKYVRRTFIVQLCNTVVIALATISVLYLFQRPQLEQMRQNQQASDKQQALSLLIAAQNISNSDDRAKVVQALSFSWPENKLLTAFARSNRTLVDARSALYPPSLEQAAKCQDINADIQKLAASIIDLNAEVVREGIGYGKGGISGFGPVAAALREQEERFVTQQDDLVAQAQSIGCKLVRK